METLPLEMRQPFQPLKWLREYFLCWSLLRTDFALVKLIFVDFGIWVCIGGYGSLQCEQHGHSSSCSSWSWQLGCACVLCKRRQSTTQTTKVP